MKINSRVNEIIDFVEKAAKEARIEAVEEVAEIAQSLAPVKTGELRDSKFTEHSDEKSVFGFSADHALTIEFGNSRQSAQPFFTPAAAQLENLVEKKFKNKLRGLK